MVKQTYIGRERQRAVRPLALKPYAAESLDLQCRGRFAADRDVLGLTDGRTWRLCFPLAGC